MTSSNIIIDMTNIFTLFSPQMVTCMVFVETLKHAHGNYTDQSIKRAGKIVGSLGKALDKAFHEHVAETQVQESFRKKFNYHKDVLKFVSEFENDKLFDNIPGRTHESFPAMKCVVTFKTPEKLKRRLLDYSKKLDNGNDIFRMMRIPV